MLLLCSAHDAQGQGPSHFLIRVRALPAVDKGLFQSMLHKASPGSAPDVPVGAFSEVQREILFVLVVLVLVASSAVKDLSSSR